MKVEIGININKAAEILKRGGLVGIPTETVYGLAANALDVDAVLKIFEVKKRPQFDPLIIHLPTIASIKRYTKELPSKAVRLFEAFSPGPLTILLEKREIVPDLVTSGLSTVAVRIPNHPLTLELLNRLDFPLAAPSANPFGYVSPTRAEHVAKQLGGDIDYILDGGLCEVGLESTIVGFENDRAIIYRLGGLSIDEIEKVAGKCELKVNQSSNPVAPGQLDSHYSPAKKFVLVDNLHSIKKADLSKAGFIGFDKHIEGVPFENQILLSARGDVNEAARNLFASLRLMDEKDLEIIFGIKVPDVGIGKAINDRLLRASA